MDFYRVLRLALEFRFHSSVQSFGCFESRNFLDPDSLQGPPALDRIDLRSAFHRIRNNGVAQDMFPQFHQGIQPFFKGLLPIFTVAFFSIFHHFGHHFDRHFTVATVAAATAFQTIVDVFHGQVLREVADTEVVFRIVRIGHVGFATT